MPDLRRALEAYVRRCCEQRCTVRLSEFALECGLSAPVLTKRFLARYHQHPSDYAKALQLSLATDLLRNTDLSLTDIAQRTGFGTPNTFFRRFRTDVGITPSAYRGKK